MWMQRARFQEDLEQPQVQAEWTLVDGQLVCQWQPLTAVAEVEQIRALPKRHKAA